MTDQYTPIGERFSHIYLRPGKLRTDSRHARLRLGSIAREELGIGQGEMMLLVRRELGLRGGYDEDKLLETCDLQHFLDFVTVVAKYLSDLRQSQRCQFWLKEVGRILQEEALGYRVDHAGGIHYVVDAEFERNRVATIASLGSARYRGVLHAFEAAQSALDEVPPDYKSAVRLSFEAAETLFKLMFVRAPKLAKAEIRQYLLPAIHTRYASDVIAKRSAGKLVDSFTEWVEAAHFYRHAQASEEPTQPPLELAILLVSEAASNIRWLGSLDGS